MSFLYLLSAALCFASIAECHIDSMPLWSPADGVTCCVNVACGPKNNCWPGDVKCIDGQCLCPAETPFYKGLVNGITKCEAGKPGMTGVDDGSGTKGEYEHCHQSSECAGELYCRNGSCRCPDGQINIDGMNCVNAATPAAAPATTTEPPTVESSASTMAHGAITITLIATFVRI